MLCLPVMISYLRVHWFPFSDMDVCCGSSFTLCVRENTQIISFWFVYSPSWKGEQIK